MPVVLFAAPLESNTAPPPKHAHFLTRQVLMAAPVATRAAQAQSTAINATLEPDSESGLVPVPVLALFVVLVLVLVMLVVSEQTPRVVDEASRGGSLGEQLGCGWQVGSR